MIIRNDFQNISYIDYGPKIVILHHGQAVKLVKHDTTAAWFRLMSDFFNKFSVIHPFRRVGLYDCIRETAKFHGQVLHLLNLF